jgi:hypothetical protein
MRAMECAGTQVHDANVDFVEFIARPLDVCRELEERRRIKAGAVSGCHRVTPVFHSAI